MRFEDIDDLDGVLPPDYWEKELEEDDTPAELDVDEIDAEFEALNDEDELTDNDLLEEDDAL